MGASSSRFRHAWGSIDAVPPFVREAAKRLQLRGYVESVESRSGEQEYGVLFRRELFHGWDAAVSLTPQRSSLARGTFGLEAGAGIDSPRFTEVFNQLELWKVWSSLGVRAPMPPMPYRFPFPVMSLHLGWLRSHMHPLLKSQEVRGHTWRDIPVDAFDGMIDELFGAMDDTVERIFVGLSSASSLAYAISSTIVPAIGKVQKEPSPRAHEYALVLYRDAGLPDQARAELELAKLRAAKADAGLVDESARQEIRAEVFRRYSAWIDSAT